MQGKNRYYSIGEVADLLGISAQTLRYYDKIGMLQPAHVNPQNGYRQYSYDQIHYIERIRYLQNLGLSLNDIRSALESGKVEEMARHLETQREEVRHKIRELRDIEESLDWYIHYYRYLGENRYPQIPFKKREDERYLMAAPLYPGEAIYGTAGYRLTQEKSKPAFRSVKFLRQTGYILDYASLLEGKIRPLSYFVYLKDVPAFQHPFLQKVPAGEYLCFRGQILLESYEPSYVRTFFRGEDKPHLVIANEYEDNFREFEKCFYEIQILL